MPPINHRIVPGTPPTSPKLRKKPKAKSGPEASADIDDVDLPTTTGPSLDAPEAEGPSVPGELKLSPIDLIDKRLNAINRKISRINPYASTDPQCLNADQKRALNSLPTLQAIQQELNEIKEAIETDEVDEVIAENLETETARVPVPSCAAQIEAVPQQPYPQVQKTCVTKTIDLLDVLRFSLMASGRLAALLTDKAEGSTIYSVADALLGTDDDKRRVTVEGFLQGSGDFDGISYTLLVGIAKSGLAIPYTPAPPLAEEPQADVKAGAEQNKQEEEQRRPEAWRLVEELKQEVEEEKPATWKSRDSMERGPSLESGWPTAGLAFPRVPAVPPAEDKLKAKTEAERKKRDKERRKREEDEKRQQKARRLVDQLKRETVQKKREEEQRKREEEQRKRQEEQCKRQEEQRREEEQRWLGQRRWSERQSRSDQHRWLEWDRQQSRLEEQRWLEEERELDDLIWMLEDWSPGMPMSLRMQELLRKFIPASRL